MRSKCLIFSSTVLEMRKFVCESYRVAIEGFCGLDKRLERQDEGSWTDLKNLHESFEP